MNGKGLEKATLPVTVVAAILMAGLGYWVNAQDAKIEDNAEDIEAVEQELADEKLETRDKISEIQTQQALSAQILQQIAEDVKEIADEIDNDDEE